MFHQTKGRKFQPLIVREVLGFFKSIGTLIAKALLDSRVLDIPFSPVFIEMCVFGHSNISKLSAIKVINYSN
jgi:hypothetical protein